MKKQRLSIGTGTAAIPAVLWGSQGGDLLLAVHGAQSNKEDPVIAVAAESAARKGFCTLSFDLPCHGDRRDGRPCLPWEGTRDLMAAYRFARSLSANISVFACSLGAYLTELILPEMEIRQLCLLSPVVDMEKLIERMMAAAGVSEERLKAEGNISVEGGEDLNYEYYKYVKDHSVKHRPGVPMAILRGEGDALSSDEEVSDFAEWYGARLTVLPGGEHWFHTDMQLQALGRWLDAYMSPVDPLPWIEELTAKSNNRGCLAMEFLLVESEKNDCLAAQLPKLFALLENKNSLVRNRAIALIAANAKWDAAKVIDGRLDAMLCHICDEKPITARQCIKALPKIAAAKSACAPRIREALLEADPSEYKDSMRPLITKDIAEALAAVGGADAL